MNKLTNSALLLVPYELLGGFLLLFLVAGGICRIVGARRLSDGLIATAIAIPLVTVVVEAVFNEMFALLPPSMVKIVAWLVIAIAYLLIFGSVMSVLFGSRAWEEAKGHLLADAIKSAVRIAFSWPILLVWGALAIYLLLS